MLNKICIFALISILLALIISKFYIEKMDKKFIFTVLILSIILFIIFYFLGSSKEHFSEDVSYFDYLEDNTNSEEKNIMEVIEEEVENRTERVPEEIYEKPINIIKNKHYQNYVIPDINKLLLSNPTPININVSYNAQNSVNEIDNNRNGGVLPNKNKIKENVGEICDRGRIYNNSDWIYGENAWTNNPDFFIPDKLKYKNPLKKISQPLNELLNKNRKSNGNVCPMMVNTPWSEYKSGDSEPEPYNL